MQHWQGNFYNVSYIVPVLKNPIGQLVYECNIYG